MKQIYLVFKCCFLLLPFLLFSKEVQAQGLSRQTCVLAYTYDASGNLLKREYVCVNSRLSRAASSLEALLSDEVNNKTEIQKIAAVYPNPSSGKLNIRLVKALEAGSVSVINLAGQVVLRSKQSGTHIQIDLSQLAPGNYVLRIVDQTTNVTQNIIKQ